MYIQYINFILYNTFKTRWPSYHTQNLELEYNHREVSKEWLPPISNFHGIWVISYINNIAYQNYQSASFCHWYFLPPMWMNRVAYLNKSVTYNIYLVLMNILKHHWNQLNGLDYKPKFFGRIFYFQFKQKLITTLSFDHVKWLIFLFKNIYVVIIKNRSI